MDQYCILGRIGEGAHGIVFKAKHVEVSGASGSPPAAVSGPGTPPPRYSRPTSALLRLPPRPAWWGCAHRFVPLQWGPSGLRPPTREATAVIARAPRGAWRESLLLFPRRWGAGPGQDPIPLPSHPTGPADLCVPPRWRLSRPRGPFPSLGWVAVSAFCPAQTGEIVALKKVALRRLEDGIPNQALREIKALQEIEDHQHVSGLGGGAPSRPHRPPRLHSTLIPLTHSFFPLLIHFFTDFFP